jgi:ribosomal protein L21E
LPEEKSALKKHIHNFSVRVDEVAIYIDPSPHPTLKLPYYHIPGKC